MPRTLPSMFVLLLCVNSAFGAEPNKTQADCKECCKGQRLAALLAERDQLQKEIESVCDAMETGEQVVVKLEILEVNLTALRENGIEIPSDRIAFQSGRDGAKMQDFLKTIRKAQWSKTLMAPTLVTYSGRPASFFVGNKLPIPPAKGSGKVVDYMEVGHRLDVLPEVLGNNTVKLHICAKVSTGGVKPDALQVEGQPMPSAEELVIDTTLEMPFGETWMLGGLVSQRTVAKQSRAGDVSEVRQEVMQMAIVTPEYQSPTAAKVAKRVSSLAK